MAGYITLVKDIFDENQQQGLQDECTAILLVTMKSLPLWCAALAGQLKQIGTNPSFINELTMVIMGQIRIAKSSRMSEKLGHIFEEHRIVESFIAMLAEICKHKAQLMNLETSALVNILDCWSMLHMVHQGDIPISTEELIKA